ncbi:MAG: SDR family NAD(P)-dependent oxidoreductase [Methylocystis sp.]
MTNDRKSSCGHCRHHSGGRPLAVVTGASAGIGFELAQVCAANNFDVAIASNKARIYDAAANLEARGANVVAIEADLSTIEGVDRLYDAAQQFGRPVDVLIANAGIGLGNAFLDRDFQKKVRDVIDTTSPEQFTRSKNRQTASQDGQARLCAALVAPVINVDGKS